MPYLYITISPTGENKCESHEKRPDYKEIQRRVGGLMQIVPYFSSLYYDGKKLNRGTAYCNEEGWLLGLPPNPNASAAWMKACPTGDPERMHIAGNLLFVVKEKVDVKAS
jgi:hypothetical protein